MALQLSAAATAWATTVYVTSVGYGDVQVVVNGRNVYSLRIGEATPEGVKLQEIQAGVATLVVDGRPMQMRIGQSTLTQVVLRADARGHFATTARINGVPLSALIDTGATHVSMSVSDAQRLGINYLQGTPALARTANGEIRTYLVNLAHVQIGDLAFANIVGEVRMSSQPQDSIVLIGMSFLRLVEMHRSGTTLTLSRADR